MTNLFLGYAYHERITTMTLGRSIFALTLFGALVAVIGCNQSEPTSSTPPPDASKNPNTTMRAADEDKAVAMKVGQADAQKQAQALIEQADQAKKAAAEKLAAVDAKIQRLIDTAKALTGENKYAEALKIINDLVNQQLTPEQRSVVDGLKKQVELALAQKGVNEAGKAIGNLINKK